MPPTDIVFGNLCSLGAMISDSISGTRTRRNHILGFQIISQVFYGVGSVILKGYSGTVQNAVAILRNLAAIKNIKSKVLEWALIVLGVALGIVFNNRGLKIAFILNMLFFVVFSVAIKNYVGTVGNIVVAVTTAIALYREKTAQRREEPDND